MEKSELLRQPVRHVNIKSFDSTHIIESMKGMSFTAGETAAAAELFERMIRDQDCTIILCVAGSTGAAGCMQVYADMIRHNMVDVVVATGASIVDMDFFEAIGFKHYKGSAAIDDGKLRELYIDRIYDTFIDEEQLQVCDNTVKQIADSMEAGCYSSRQFISRMGEWLTTNARKRDSLVQAAYENEMPVFCPAFSDSSAGFGLVKHQVENEQSHVSIDSVKDFRELTQIKIESTVSGLFIVGGGAPKNFAQDSVVCAEVLGKPVQMHKYAVQITVADVRDGACSGSTLKEARSWGKVDAGNEQMVYAEATSVLPLIVSYVYHQRSWQSRPQRKWNRLFEG